jgi:hypothetical protein
MTMDDDSSNPAVFPPNLREELEKSEIEVCKRKELVTVGQFYNIFNITVARYPCTSATS